MTAVDARTQTGRFGSQVTAPLIAIGDAIRQHGGATPAANIPVAPPLAIDGAAAVEPGLAVTPPPVGPAAAPPDGLDRARALAVLEEIAEFFDRTEPQSLIGQGLRELVRRANLTLGELIGELLPDREQRAMFMLRAGIRAEQASNEGGYTTF